MSASQKNLKMPILRDDYEKIKKLLKRDPNETEQYIFSAMWSEHCGYKHSKRLIKEHFNLSDENAGLVWIDDIGIAFKVESHNHPCAVEPFQGAATGIGGIIRDVIAMGARPVALLDSLHFAEPHSHIYEGVISGISVYGNSIGVPTVGGEIRFHSGYSYNPLVNVMAVGVVKKGDVKTSKAQGAGNSVVLVGSKTGRDGLHGASFASRKIDETLNDRPSVQVGDPFSEKRLIEATMEICKLDCVIAVQDMGAAGILSSTTEMADHGGLGLDLFVDRVPLREKGMKEWEILLSESQERMSFLVKKDHEEEVESIAKKWELDFAKIGETTSSGEFRVFNKNKRVSSLPLTLVTQPPDLSREIEKEYSITNRPSFWSGRIQGTLLKLLSNPTIASKKCVYERYDHSVGGETVKPPSFDAAVIHVKGQKGIALSLGGNASYTELNPLEGTKAVLFEACANVIASGGKPLGVTNCMNFGNPEIDEIAAQFYATVRGLEESSKLLGIPITGGNVSFYNESNGQEIPPTPVVGVVGVVEDIRKVPSSHFVNFGDSIYLVGRINLPENGAAMYLKGNTFCEVDWENCAKTLKTVQNVSSEDFVLSLHDVSDGGIAVACAEMAIESMKGVRMSTMVYPFEEYPARFVLEVLKGKEEEFERNLKSNGVEFEKIGIVDGNSFVWNLESVPLSSLKKAYASLGEEW